MVAIEESDSTSNFTLKSSQFVLDFNKFLVVFAPQIDGSTLRTLCMQHGPLQNFHLYLTHGIALCKYSSREEAQKAQTALNNCVLGNTTICAESPSENEVQSILQHLGAPSGGGGGNGGNGNSSASAGLSQTSWRPPSQGGPARPTGTLK